MASLFASGGQKMAQLLQTLDSTLKLPALFDQNVARTQDLILAWAGRHSRKTPSG
jgi:hypothetical protein